VNPGTCSILEHLAPQLRREPPRVLLRSASQRRIYIGMDGEAFPCCAPVRPMVGNVFQQDFFAIWNSPECQRLRDGLYNGELTDYCRRCPFLQQTGDMVYSKG
jgi:radical SAM protein with 4Fe4S-binding SPASM domain